MSNPLVLQARYFFQQLISGVSYCHSMVFFKLPPCILATFFFLQILLQWWHLVICHISLHWGSFCKMLDLFRIIGCQCVENGHLTSMYA
jgi:hypothetical protein